MPQSAEDPGLACCENEVTGPTVAQEALHESAESSNDAGGSDFHRPNQGAQSNRILGLTPSDRLNSQADGLATQEIEEKAGRARDSNSRTAGQALTFRQGRPVTNKVLIPESDSRNAAARRVSAWFQRAYARCAAPALRLLIIY